MLFDVSRTPNYQNRMPVQEIHNFYMTIYQNLQDLKYFQSKVALFTSKSMIFLAYVKK